MKTFGRLTVPCHSTADLRSPRKTRGVDLKALMTLCNVVISADKPVEHNQHIWFIPLNLDFGQKRVFGKLLCGRSVFGVNSEAKT